MARKPATTKAVATRSTKAARSRKGKGGPMSIALGPDLRIGQAGEVFARILAARNATGVVLEGGDVAKVDAAGLQALVAALVTLRTAAVGWQWQTPSGTLSGAAALAGLDAVLQLK